METILGAGNLLVDRASESRFIVSILSESLPCGPTSPMRLQVFCPLKQWKLFITLQEWFSNFSVQKNHFGMLFFFRCRVPIPSPLQFWARKSGNTHFEQALGDFGGSHRWVHKLRYKAFYQDWVFLSTKKWRQKSQLLGFLQLRQKNQSPPGLKAERLHIFINVLHFALHWSFMKPWIPRNHTTRAPAVMYPERQKE